MKIRKRTDAGYSILELLTVVAIIGIIVLVSVPNFAQYMRAAKLKSSMRQLAYHVRSARQRAVSRNDFTRVRFTFSAKNSAYILEESTDGKPLSDASKVWVTYVSPKSVGDPLYLVKGNADQFTFAANGMSYNADGTIPATALTVQIKSRDKIPVTQYTITLERYGKLTTS
ncbi:MAG TPA: prepilin-type N-terminal cleavage/methylation domain-containing protein [Thermoanaerobaculia bacterium]